MSWADKAREFHALHREGLLILPNAWDAASARIVEHAGARAVATSSAAVAWAHGYPDGEAIAPEVLLSTIREIVRVVSIPVSADIEAGYATDAEGAARFAARAMEAGAVGVNIEDGRGSSDLLCAKIERVRRANADLWINARVDVYLHKLAEGEAACAETVARAKRYAQAGANSIFVPGAVEESLLARLVRAIPLPLNSLAWPGLPDAAKLKELGVRRLSAGAGLAKASLAGTHELAQDFLRYGRSAPLFETSLGSVNINGLMKRD